MKCPYCGNRGLKKLKGYCCKAHRKLHKLPQKKNIPCRGCGAPQRRAPSAISRSGIVYCKRCKKPSGENHYKFNEGSYVDKAGYRMVLLGSQYVREHRQRWEEANDACLLSRGSIHHIRFDLPHNKIYNDPDNLLLLSDEEHGRFHRLFDANRLEEAFEILRYRAQMQLHYPAEIDKFINSVTNTEDVR